VIDTISIDERCLNIRPGYADLFVAYHAKQLGWPVEFTTRVTRDAVRFLALCAIPPAGQENISETRVTVSSPIVDKIVDAIFLDSLLLRQLEDNVFGVRLLHIPYYAHGTTDQAINNAHYDFTIALMRAAHYEIDEDIWPARLPVGYLTCTCSNDTKDCQMRAQRG